MISKKTKEFRENFVKEFLDSIDNPKTLDWREPWKVTGMPENAVTGKRYGGINLVYLNHMANVFNKEDNRWATFNQIRDKGWFLKKRSKGSKVEYWIPYDFVDGKMQAITWNDYRKLEDKTDVVFRAKYYTVFNGDDIVGIPEAEPGGVKQDIKADELVEKLSKNMNVEISYTGRNYAFYSPNQDKIFLPEAKDFDSEYDLNATALHELAHATGAEHRLNRDLKGSYAFEELIAELTSCFMAHYVDVPKTEVHLDNHKAYLKAWAKEIKNDPNYLFSAIKKSYEATEYLEEKAEIKIEKKKICEVKTDRVYGGQDENIISNAITENGEEFKKKNSFQEELEF